MSVDTRLLLNSKWELDEIKDVMENHLDLIESERKVKTVRGERVEKYKIETTSNHHVAPGYFNFTFKVSGSKDTRWMHVHTNYSSPLGSCTLLSLGAFGEAVNIMSTIADVLGGFLMEDDCSDKGYYERDGKLSDRDGLPYFLKRAIIHDKIDTDDLKGLNESIHKWYDRMSDCKRENINLFPRSKK